MQIFGKRGAIFMSAAAVLIIAACGGEDAATTVPATSTVPVEPTAAVVVPTETAVPVATVEPTAAAEPVAAVTPEPTATRALTPTPEPTATLEPAVTLEPTATPIPTATPKPTPTPVTRIDEFGFTLGLNRGAYPQTLQGSTSNQGMTQLEYSGVNVILSWVPVNGVTPQGLVSGTFDLLQQNQPELTLETVSESDLRVGLEEGIVLGFRSVDIASKVIGGGLIGAWQCLDIATSFSMIATGDDATVVQLRFDRLVDDFSCDGG